MSSSDLPRRRALALLSVAGLALLGGCGFEPLYGTRGRSTTAAGLQTVRISLIADRVGQQVRNVLLDRMNPGGEPSNPVYELEVSLTERREELGIRKDETATRANLTLLASFVLNRIEGEEEPSLTGNARSTNSFNIVESDFGTLAAESNARQRAAERLADEIAARVAIWFNGEGAES